MWTERLTNRHLFFTNHPFFLRYNSREAWQGRPPNFLQSSSFSSYFLLLLLCIYMHLCMHITWTPMHSINICVHAYTCTHIHSYKYTHAHTYTYTHTYGHLQISLPGIVWSHAVRSWWDEHSFRSSACRLSALVSFISWHRTSVCKTGAATLDTMFVFKTWSWKELVGYHPLH